MGRDMLSTLRVSPTTNMVPTGLPSRPSRPISVAKSTTARNVSNGTCVSSLRKSWALKRSRCSPRWMKLIAGHRFQQGEAHAFLGRRWTGINIEDHQTGMGLQLLRQKDVRGGDQ